MTGLKIIEMQPKPREVNQDIVNALVDATMLAQKGEIIGVALTYMTNENKIIYIKGGIHSMGTIGALQLMSNQIERALE